MRPLPLAACFVIAASAASAQDGQTQYNNACRTCHSMKAGDNRLGPSLAGIVGKKAGSAGDYPYSESLKASGIVWDDATLDKFIEDPEAVVRGNRMKPYGGIADAQQRADIIAFLKGSG